MEPTNISFKKKKKDRIFTATERLDFMLAIPQMHNVSDTAAMPAGCELVTSWLLWFVSVIYVVC